METYLSSAAPIFVGGLAGHIFPPEPGRVVGGCVGIVRVSQGELRHVGGCVGHVCQPADRRYVGGCAGSIALHARSAETVSRATRPPRPEPRTVWGEGAIAESVV
jgi:hypothetical protein